MMRSIGLPELLIILFILAVPVGIGLLIVLLVRKNDAHNPPPASAFPVNVFCTQCGNPFASPSPFCGRCGARRG